jgi:hypothetical protein
MYVVMGIAFFFFFFPTRSCGGSDGASPRTCHDSLSSTCRVALRRIRALFGSFISTMYEAQSTKYSVVFGGNYFKYLVIRLSPPVVAYQWQISGTRSLTKAGDIMQQCYETIASRNIRCQNVMVLAMTRLR